jgi:hypothetical protein
MAQPVLHIGFGDGTEFALARLSAQEVIKAKTWIGCRNMADWFNQISEGEPEALLAAMVIAKQRKGENVDYATADFCYDDLSARFVDDAGREVEPVFEENPDGTTKLVDGRPVPKFDGKGEPMWRDTSGNVVPFGTSGSRTTSDTPLTPGSSSGSATG